jgi:hypothetical protein
VFLEEHCPEGWPDEFLALQVYAISMPRTKSRDVTQSKLNVESKIAANRFFGWRTGRHRTVEQRGAQRIAHVISQVDLYSMRYPLSLPRP